MKFYIWIIILVVIGGFGLALLKQNSVISAPVVSGPYDTFAQCLKDKGAVFYGASWCSHCQAQKADFGVSAHLLPYVECGTSDGKGQMPECAAKNIQSYPTWIFSDGTQAEGEQTMSVLAEKTKCVPPEKPATE